jgi:hypothetical protein
MGMQLLKIKYVISSQTRKPEYYGRFHQKTLDRVDKDQAHFYVANVQVETLYLGKRPSLL